MTHDELDAGLLALLPGLDEIPAEDKEGMSPFILNTANVISVVGAYLLFNQLVDPSIVAAYTAVTARAAKIIEDAGRVETSTPGTLEA